MTKFAFDRQKAAKVAKAAKVEISQCFTSANALLKFAKIAANNPSDPAILANISNSLASGIFNKNNNISMISNISSLEGEKSKNQFPDPAQIKEDTFLVADDLKPHDVAGIVPEMDGKTYEGFKAEAPEAGLQIEPMTECLHGEPCPDLDAPGGTRPVCQKSGSPVFDLTRCPKALWFYQN